MIITFKDTTTDDAPEFEIDLTTMVHWQNFINDNDSLITELKSAIIGVLCYEIRNNPKNKKEIDPCDYDISKIDFGDSL